MWLLYRFFAFNHGYDGIDEFIYTPSPIAADHFYYSMPRSEPSLCIVDINSPGERIHHTVKTDYHSRPDVDELGREIKFLSRLPASTMLMIISGFSSRMKLRVIISSS
jgi:hypothetical protein